MCSVHLGDSADLTENPNMLVVCGRVCVLADPFAYPLGVSMWLAAGLGCSFCFVNTNSGSCSPAVYA